MNVHDGKQSLKTRSSEEQMRQKVDLHSMLKTQFDQAFTFAGVVAADVGKIVSEAQEFSVSSLQANAALVGKLAGARTIDELVKVHSDHARTTYEATVSRSGKIGALLTELSMNALHSVSENAEKAKTPTKPQLVAKKLQAAE
jgi:hypothetical protein